MKKEEGITLVSLIVYVLLLTFIIAGLSSITASFYSNIDEFDSDSESAVAYTKFNMYFLSDIKRKNAVIESCQEKYVIIAYEVEGEELNDAGISIEGKHTKKVEYSVQNNSLYRDKVKICDNIKEILFSCNDEDNTLIKVTMQIDNYRKTCTYKLENVNNDVEDTENYI